MSKFISEFKSSISPVEYMKLMFKYTSEDGVLYFPGWFYVDRPVNSIRCKIKWNKQDLEETIDEFNNLNNNLQKIAELFKKAGEDISNIKDILTNPELYAVWSRYLKPFVYKNTSSFKINDIKDKLLTINDIKKLKRKMFTKEDIEAYEKRFYDEYKNLEMTKEELAIYDDYCLKYYDDIERRVGDNVGAKDLVLAARKLCKLYELNVPLSTKCSEACMLASALVVHKYATSLEEVNDFERYQVERLYTMSEEEQEEFLDSLCRPKKKNNRKHNLNLFVYLILKEHSTNLQPLSQAKILDLLYEEYELEVERKALSRAIHDIEDEQLGIHCDARIGAWYDSKANSHDQ